MVLKLQLSSIIRVVCISETSTSLSPYACAAKTLVRKTKVASSIEIAYFVKMQKSLLPYACAAKTLVSADTNAKRLIGVSQECKKKQMENN